MGKKHECEHEDAAWEIALADLMTVLMVFFLVMWLTSIIDPEQRKAFVESVLGEGGGADSVVDIDPVNPRMESTKAKKDPKPEVSTEEIEEALKKINPKDVDIEDTPQGIKITLRSDSFFESGRATIKDETREQLENLGETLIGRNSYIAISGYTDDVPISNFQFPSNWELSAARAATVARTFIYMGVEQKWVNIQGFASNEAVAKNNSSYGRSLNRRVIILIKKSKNNPELPLP